MKTRKYDTELYPLWVIKQAVADYAHIAKIIIIPGNSYISCHFLWCRVDEQRTVDEFSNYLIDMIGSRGQ